MKKTEFFSLNRAFFVKTFCVTMFLLLTAGIKGHTETYAQNANLTIHMTNSSLKEVFNHIEKTSEFIFVYHGTQVDLDRKVSLNLSDKSIEQVLDNVFRNTNLEYVVRDRQVIVRKKDTPEAMTAPKTNNQQQSRVTVAGKIVDSKGEELIGVNIYIAGTNTGTITDIDGNFILKDVLPDATLVVSYIGYKRQDIPLNGRTTLNIRLEEDSETLDEIVVVGYGTQKKSSLSGAIDVLSAKTLENRPIVNLGQGLQGAVPNLNVTIPSGSSNEAPKFNIRGIASIDENSGEPLILVDNIPTTAAELSRLNTNDIESISVLKDASSAAIYGARAAFGVILVTTKSAKSEKLSVGVNAYYSTRRITRLPEHVTDPYLVMDLKNQASWPLYNPLYTPEQMAEAKKYSENPSLDPVGLNPTNKDMWAYYGQTNWMDEVYENSAPSYTVNVNISQRTSKAGYYLSTEYYDRDGMFKYGNDSYKRYNLRSKVDYQLTPWLNVSNNTAFTYRTYDEPSFGAPGWEMVDFFHMVNRTNSLDVPTNPDGTWTQNGAGILGRLQDGGRNVSNNREFFTSFAFVADVIKDTWQIKGDASFRRNSEQVHKSYFPVYYKRGPEMAIEDNGTTPSARNESYFIDYNVFNLYTDFHKTFNQKHYVQALVGFNQEMRRSSESWVSRAGLISDGSPSINLATGTINTKETIKEWAVRGMFFRFNYIYDSKYIFELNGRYDGSSKFPKDDRFGFFPSASAGWLISEESFFEPIKSSGAISMLKLRGSYGTLGNQSVNEYAYIPSMSTMTISQILDGEKPLGIRNPNIVASSLTWEKVSTVNGGIDLSFLNGKLNATFDYYVRNTTGMLTKGKTLPNVLGVREPQENAADLRTRGWELSLAWRDQFSLAGSPFHYNVRFVLADSRTFITKFDNYINIYDTNGKVIGQTSSLDDHYVGKEWGEIWGLTTEGFFQTQEELDNHADQTAVGEDDNGYLFYVGDLKFKDLNNDGKIDKGDWTLADPGDYKIIGNSSSRFPYSIDLSGDWKGFDLRLFFQGIGKRDWYAEGSNHYFWGIYAQPWTNVQKHNLDHWTPENRDAYFPRVKAYIAEDTGSELAAPQTKYLQNASYLRLKNLTFGYTLPRHITQKLKLDYIRFYFSGENLCEFSHLKANLDPEALDKNGRVYPMQRSYSFGVNLNF